MTGAAHGVGAAADGSAPPPFKPVAVVAQSLVCAAGTGLQAFAQHLRSNRSALQPNTFTASPLPHLGG